MPIRFAIMCEKCKRIYLVAHPDSAKRIHLTSGSEPHPPYRLTCICTAERCFDSAQTLPYRVSDLTCNRGYAPSAMNTKPYRIRDSQSLVPHSDTRQFNGCNGLLTISC